MRNHEDFGSPDLYYPYETRLPFRCIPKNENLFEIINKQINKQLWKIRNNDTSHQSDIDYILREFVHFAKIRNFNQLVLEELQQSVTKLNAEAEMRKLSSVFDLEENIRRRFDSTVKVIQNGEVGIHKNVLKNELEYISNRSRTRVQLRESILPSSNEYNFNHFYFVLNRTLYRVHVCW